MKEVRCPDCGYRLKTNQCPICLKRVPFPGIPQIQKTQPREVGETRPHIPVRPRLPRKKKQTTSGKNKVGAIIGIVIALISLVMSIVEDRDVSESVAMPDYNYEAFQYAGSGDAQYVPVLEQQQVYNHNGVSVTVDGLGLYYGDYAVSLTVNNDSDQDIILHGNEISVNSYMLPTVGWYCEVPEEKELQSFLILPEYDLHACGIYQIGEVAFWLDLYEDRDYTNIDRTEVITLQTQAYGTFTQEVDDSGMECYRSEDVVIKLRDVELSDYGMGYITVFIQNTSDMTVTLMDMDLQVNDQWGSGMIWFKLRPNTQSVDYIYLNDLEEMGITDLDQLKTISASLYTEYSSPGGADVVETKEEDWVIDLTPLTGGTV